jgi:hypothetical protein
MQRPLGPSLEQVPLWFFQSIAAFPVRNEPAPAPVYAAGVILLGALVCLGFKEASKKLRFVLIGLTLASIAIPFAVTLSTISSSGPLWQGRYTLPIAVGALLLSGLALDRAYFHPRLQTPIFVTWAIGLFTMHVMSIVGVHSGELAGSPLTGDPRWLTAAPWVVSVIALGGVSCWWYACLRQAAVTVVKSTPSSQSDSNFSPLN